MAIVNLRRTHCNKVFLTLIGGGAFGNPTDWIIASIGRALVNYAESPLEVAIVSRGSSRACVRELIERHP